MRVGHWLPVALTLSFVFAACATEKANDPATTAEEFFRRLAERDRSGMKELICQNIGEDSQDGPILLASLLEEAQALPAADKLQLEDFEAEEVFSNDRGSLVNVSGLLQGESSDTAMRIDDVLALRLLALDSAGQYGETLYRWCILDSMENISFDENPTLFEGLPLTVSLEPKSGARADGSLLQIRPDDVIFEFPESFQVEVTVRDVRGLAGFDFQITYDRSLLSPAGVEQEGFIFSAVREPQCRASFEDGLSTFQCVANDPPPCLGGPPGASGDGTLVTVSFQPKRLGETRLEFQNVKLVAEDPVPCDLSGVAVALPVASIGANVTVQFTP